MLFKGLLSLDITKLEIKSITGTEKEKSAAVCVLPIIKQHHLLLVTLLLFNSLANETLPIFLGALVRASNSVVRITLEHFMILYMNVYVTVGTFYGGMYVFTYV